jgi:hypothetical protein
VRIGMAENNRPEWLRRFYEQFGRRAALQKELDDALNGLKRAGGSAAPQQDSSLREFANRLDQQPLVRDILGGQPFGPTVSPMPQYLEDETAGILAERKQKQEKERGVFRFSRNEVVMLVIGTALALGSLKADDPWVVAPMLFVALGAFIYVCYVHAGAWFFRLLAAAVISTVIGFIGFRVLRKADSANALMSIQSITAQERAERFALRIQITELIQRGRILETNMLKIGKRQIPNPRPVVASLVNDTVKWHVEVTRLAETNFGHVEAMKVMSPPVVIDFPPGLDGLQSFRDGKPGGYDLTSSWTQVVGDLAVLERFLNERPEL